jgi:hypothetical protein
MKTPLAVRFLRGLFLLAFFALVSVRAEDVDSLVKVLRDPGKSADAKGDACLALMDMGSAAEPAVSALVGLLNNPEEMLRDYAVTTLDRIGPAARNALPALRRAAVRDASQEIRELARSAIKDIGGQPRAVPVNAGAGPVSEAQSAPAPDQAATAEQAAAPAGQAETQLAQSDTAAAVIAGPSLKSEQIAPRATQVAARPTLEVHTGRFFRWAVPLGWVGSESGNGVTLTSPDGLMQVSSALLLSSPGTMTPSDFALWMLGQLPENQGLQVIAKRDLPDQPSGIDLPWKVQEIEMRYTVNGAPVRATWTAGTINMDGAYDGYLIGFQSVPSKFDAAKLWLACIAHSVALASPVQGEGNAKLLIPTNRPIDYPALLAVWRGQGRSEDRILRAQSAGMMGYERVKDPQTSRIFEMPLEVWDSAVGGYHNPVRPDETIQPTPGEE